MIETVSPRWPREPPGRELVDHPADLRPGRRSARSVIEAMKPACFSAVDGRLAGLAEHVGDDDRAARDEDRHLGARASPCGRRRGSGPRPRPPAPRRRAGRRCRRARRRSSASSAAWSSRPTTSGTSTLFEPREMISVTVVPVWIWVPAAGSVPITRSSGTVSEKPKLRIDAEARVLERARSPPPRSGPATSGISTIAGPGADA